MIEKHEFLDAFTLVQAAQSITVVGHLRPDADAIGSVTSTVLSLQQIGKEAVGAIGQTDSIPENLLTIPGSESVYFGDTLPESDLVIVVDCGSIERTGAFVDTIVDIKDKVIVVDHHATNPGFGEVNLIDVDAESTTTILYDWFDAMSIQITPSIAHGLYAGLLTDTGCFRWGRPVMHDMAKELMEFGLDIRVISAQLLDQTSVDDLRLVGQIVSRIELLEAGPYTLAVLVADYDTIHGRSKAVVEGLIEMVRAVDGADFGAVFKEYERGVYTVSLRSSHLSVASLAVHLGGGGHIPAAGYTARGTEIEALDTLIDATVTLGESLRSATRVDA
ncbi:exopolyphosphatase [Corynebacterium deserti GIMN1.010]|uniref:Exopolyphosphatase n=1 Tax=Corynebacterium deserti GIMN1.010 TaxID=931089 RepID=A0A0M3Q9R6_9CORY|nr:bifunctional oligoribonuclease/PAP phosphatase NrnA [Corynebacterium deserti]ALC06169.1 exopolyphosphatase [Corynebacterium deserti GIMN1.010]